VNAPRDRTRAEVGSVVKISGRPGLHRVAEVRPTTGGVKVACGRGRFYAATTARVVAEPVLCFHCDRLTK